ncbi:MAG TPA: response regulator [Spirochaetota bacterium]|nr:response regulator [Spirochaetota bacterium]HOM39069.1 response regulator [Spirochaetota bacterium]HPQ49975.1 response regulator [Spirochaetota bacterium]
MKVVIADDESLTLIVTKKMLSSLGHNVVGEAFTGDEALKLVKDYKPDIVFMDIAMPYGKLDGIEAAKIILNEYKIPVIFITAYAEKVMEDRLESIKSLYGYIVKPFSLEDLENQIKKILN